MWVLYIINLILLAGVVCLSGKEPAASGKIFYKPASFLFRAAGSKGFKSTGKMSKPARDMKTLYPGKDIDKKVQVYYIEKIRVVLFIIFAGNIISLAFDIQQGQSSRITEGGLVWKNTWEQGGYTLALQAEPSRAESDWTEEMSVFIEPRRLKPEEVRMLAEEAFIKLADILPGQNAGMEQITGSINMVPQLDNYPFRIDWESDRPDLVKPTGEVINGRIGTEGETVTVTADLIYAEEASELHFRRKMQLRVFPPSRPPEEEWKDRLWEALNMMQEKYAYLDTLQLPRMIQGVAVRWKEKTNYDSLYLWIIICLSSFLYFTGRDNDLHKKAVKRNKRLEREYPELVSKLVLYLGAGMTVRHAWKRVIDDYTGLAVNTRYHLLCEEMLISWRELENGVSEGEVYYRFGRRLGGARYRKLSGLLCNHLQKGNKNLLQVLRGEADLALEERKDAARITGEEMGVKLLFPMMIMLLIVMVVIMVPAYAAF